MAPMIAESQILENGGCSLVTEPPKYKRRRVSAVRDFPPGCGPNAPRADFNGNKTVSCGDGVKDTEHPAHDCSESSKNETKKENSEHPAGDSGNHASVSCVDTTTYVLKGGKTKLTKDERADNGLLELSKNLGSDHMPVEITMRPCSMPEPLQAHTEHVIKDSLHEPPEDLTEVMHETPTGGSNSQKGLETKEISDVFVTEENSMVAKGKSPPHHSIPSTIVWKERNYPPRRRVSAVRTFPAGCGTNVPLNSNCEQAGPSLDDREMTEETKVSEISKADVTTDVNEMGVRVDDVDVVLGADMANSDIDDLGETNTQLALVQSPESPNEHIKMDEPQSSEGEKHEQLKESEGKDRKELIVYNKDTERKRSAVYLANDTALQVENVVPSYPKDGLVIVHALMAADNCPWQQGSKPVKATPSSVKATPSSVKATPSSVKATPSSTKAKSSTSRGNGNRRKKCIVDKRKKLKFVYTEAMEDDEQQEEESMNKAGPSAQDSGVVGDEMGRCDERNTPKNVKQRKHTKKFNVSLPPLGASSSSGRGSRNKVRETLRLFQAVLRKLLQELETKPKDQKNLKSRIDLQAAKILKEKGKYINTGKQIIGPIAGVEVGDEFHYRVELMMIGLHRQSQAGIDFVKLDNKKIIATSIVASGGYDNDLDNTDVLIFSGQGGNLAGGDKEPEDQKLERGNLALKNSIDDKNVVRVIRGVKETKTSEGSDGRSKVTMKYTYDGLYTVERYWQDVGQHGKMVYKFELKRLPDQPELAWKEVKKTKKFKNRVGCCVDDISDGKEKFPICAINTVDDEKPPSFTYIKKMMYPDWCTPLSAQGCHCKNGCSDSSQCPCVEKNGGEIPFNFDGAIVEAKPLVFECGPTCKCPASCHNRVSQNGIRFQLEIFKTEHRGWGVRSLYSIPSGSFICEYMGELLEEKEAEQRAGNDEYLFDIGQNYNDHSLWEGLSGLMPDATSSSNGVVDVGFTIDAAQYGNIGRFINHSCSPNLYAQNVLYDHDDRRIPHIMFFAAENIPPLQELTYHYNYKIDQVFDKDGNIKIKNCYCGSSDCTGRLY